MVYTALLAAFALAEPLYGAIVMVAFGLGTLPAMAAVSLFAVRVRAVNRSRPLRLGASATILALGVFGIAKAAYPGLFEGLAGLCIGPSGGL
jgi:sulfite exporter TauE/SafE